MIMAQSKEPGLDAASRPAPMIQYGPGANWRPSREKPTVSLAGVRGSGMRAVSLRRWQGAERRRQIVEVSGGHTAAVLLVLMLLQLKLLACSCRPVPPREAHTHAVVAVLTCLFPSQGPSRSHGEQSC